MTGIIDDRQNCAKIKPIDFTLVAPNRRDPIMTVAFELPHSNRVTLDLYNVLGLKTASLVDAHLDRGVHRFRWNTLKTANGCYLAKLQVGKNSFARNFRIVR
jgi:hypothetical protein